MLAWTANDHKDGPPRSRGHAVTTPRFRFLITAQSRSSALI